MNALPVQRRILFAAALAAVVILGFGFAGTPKIVIPVDQRRALDAVSATSLKANLSFLASDELKGRYTPSPELDIAARFIATEFQHAGLEPAGNEGFFQVVDMVRRTNGTPSSLTAAAGSQDIVVPAKDITVQRSSDAVHLKDAPLAFVAAQDIDALKNVDIAGKVMIVPGISFQGKKNEEIEALFVKAQVFSKAVDERKPAAVIVVGRAPRRRILLFANEAAILKHGNAPPSLWISGDEAQALLKAAHESATPVRISVDVSAPKDEPLQLRNVVGILRGSDPKLKETAVMVSAHYDHIGTAETATGSAMSGPTDTDKIYNGANDDGSGTVSVIEIGKALAKLPRHPRRSVLFVTFFGEEVGGFGSRYFGEHPPLPVSNIVGDVNLEQVGRTDSSKGPQIATASITGYDYSNVTKYLERAGLATGIKVYKDDEASDAFFTRSDNATLAMRGVPAHSLTTAFVYPDYHAVGDEWQKIDYDNMAKVDRMVALALMNMANSATPPAWDPSNAKVKTFLEAQKKEAAAAASHDPSTAR